MPVLDRMDAEYAAIMRQMPIIDLHDIGAARAAMAAIYGSLPDLVADPAVDRWDVAAPGLAGEPDAPLRVFRPHAFDGAIPCLYWIQGGGYVLPAREFDDQLCERIARDHQCVVISVRYRLAPECPFPAAHNDCFAGLNWVFENSELLRIDGGRVAIAGASAGGGAAAAVALHIRDEGRFALRHQLLIYPMLDDRNETPSSHAVTDAELWCREANMLAWKAYLADAGGVSRYAAPAREANLKGLAPTTILTADLDLFFDENLIYASRLVAAGVPLELHVFPGVGHGFDVLNPDGDTSRRFFVNFDEALQRAFAIV